MQRIVGVRGSIALILSAGALMLAMPGLSLAASPGAVARTFSYIARANSRTATVVNIDSLLINARCDSHGFPKGSRGVLVSTTSSDFDATGMLTFETSTGKVVTVNYAFDNSTTLNRQHVCTVFGSYVAT